MSWVVRSEFESMRTSGASDTSAYSHKKPPVNTREIGIRREGTRAGAVVVAVTAAMSVQPPFGAAQRRGDRDRNTEDEQEQQRRDRRTRADRVRGAGFEGSAIEQQAHHIRRPGGISLRTA